MSKALAAQPGDVINKIAIRVSFDAYFDQIMVPSYLEALPRASRKAPPTFKVKQVLPSQADYLNLKKERFTTTVDDLVSSAKDRVEELGSELRSWHDNLPEGLNSSDKAGEIDEAASALENVSFPDVPESVSDVSVVHLPSLEQDSRPKRSAEVVSMLDNAIEALNSKADELREELANAKTEEDAAGEESPANAAESSDESQVSTAEHEETIEEIESFVSELENAKSELESVSYPAMR